MERRERGEAGPARDVLESVIGTNEARRAVLSLSLYWQAWLHCERKLTTQLTEGIFRRRTL